VIDKEGPGWRLARDTSRKYFPIMIGGSGWAIELTESEWQDLVYIVLKLVDQHNQLKSQLMEEESICLEIENSYWWGCLDGDGTSWSLQLIFQGNGESLRGFEVFWPKPEALHIASEMRIMWDSCH